jgi:uncharacterized YccA/Bax inhibitor family protein
MQCLLQLDMLLQVSGITPGRAEAILPAVLGLISVIVGWLTLARSARRIQQVRMGAIVGLVMGLIDIILSGMHLVRTSSIGTGSGRLGAIVALVFGLIGIVLGAQALVRSRKNATRSDKERS